MNNFPKILWSMGTFMTSRTKRHNTKREREERLRISHVIIRDTKEMGREPIPER